jgi:hypothetical protein
MEVPSLLSIFSGLKGTGLFVVVLAEILLFAGIILGFVYVLWPLLTYPDVLFIRRFVNGGWQVKGKAYGKTVVVDGKEMYKVCSILKKPVFIEPIPNEYRQVLGRKRAMIDMIEDNNGELRPMSIGADESDDYILLPNDKDVTMWAQQARKATFEDYKKVNPLLQWMPFIFSGMSVIFMFVIFLIMTQQFSEVVEHIGRLIDALTTAFPK